MVFIYFALMFSLVVIVRRAYVRRDHGPSRKT